MEEKINLEDLIKKAEEEAREAYEQGAGKTLTVQNAVAALGASAEGYIKTWFEDKRTLPDAEQRRAVISMIIGVMAALRIHDAFGIDNLSLLKIAIKMYDTALYEVVRKAAGNNMPDARREMAGGKDEYRVNIINIKREPNPGEPEED